MDIPLLHNWVDKLNTSKTWRNASTWDSIQERMSSPVTKTEEERNISPLFTGCLLKEAKDAKLQPWGGYSRCQDNVIEVPFLVLDVDNQTADKYTLEDVCDFLSGIEALIYTSYNHRNPDKDNGVDKFRVIIPFTTPCPVEEYKQRMKSMSEAFAFGARESFTLSQPFWPALVHPDRKHLFEYRKIDGDVLDWREFEAFIEPIRPPRNILNLNAPEGDIRSALASIPNDNKPYTEWLSIGAALKSELPGNDGLMLWKEWSSKSPKHTDAECERAWPTLNRQSGKIATVGTIFFLAKQNGWVKPRRTTEYGDKLVLVRKILGE